MKWLRYSIATGEVVQLVDALSVSEVAHLVDTEFDVLEVGPGFSFDRAMYVNDGEVLFVAEAPSPFHTWDWPTRTWVPNPAVARLSRKAEVDAERARRSMLPIQFDNSPFDADTIARERISGTINRITRGDGLPANWMGWRDADNAMHWTEPGAADVLVELRGLSSAIEDREQALLISAWTHKFHIDNLPDDVGAILAYDITSGWPS